jgi:hypothetical protein
MFFRTSSNMIAQVFPETNMVVAAMGISLALAILFAVWLWRSISTISNLRAAQSDFERRLAVEGQKVLRIPDLELSLRDKEAQLEQLRNGKAAIQAELATSTEALARTLQKSERATRIAARDDRADEKGIHHSGRSSLVTPE